MRNSNIQQQTLFENPTNFNQPHPSFIEAQLASALDAQEIPYKREHPIGRFRADFAFLEHRLVVEVDGYQFHHTTEQRQRDAQRTRILMLLGWREIRFTGSEIYRDVERCVTVIALMLKTLPTVEEVARAA